MSLIMSLLKQVLEQPQLTLHPRPVDSRWFYSNRLQISTTGFTPLARAVHISKNSYLGKLVANGSPSHWPQWDGDSWLRYEASFAVHDYLHVWAIEECRKRHPGFEHLSSADGNTSLLRRCWLLSEAAATVGLDFWCLSRESEGLDKPLTTPYLLDRDGSKFGDIDTQSPSFFRWISRGYLTGRFEGLDDIENCPLWAKKEVQQGIKQRHLFDDWLFATHQTSVEGVRELTADDMTLIDHVAETLWTTMHEYRKLPSLELSVDVAPSLERRILKPDFRFFNIHSNLLWRDVPWDITGLNTVQFGYLLNQYVSTFPFAELVSQESLDRLIWDHDVEGLRRLCADWTPLYQCADQEMQDMFFPS